MGTSDANGEPGRALYGYGDKEFTYDADLAGTSLYTSCHAADPHIPLKRFEDSDRVMEGLGATVTARVKPGQGHGIDEQDVVAIREALSAQA